MPFRLAGKPLQYLIGRSHSLQVHSLRTAGNSVEGILEQQEDTRYVEPRTDRWHNPVDRGMRCPPEGQKGDWDTKSRHNRQTQALFRLQTPLTFPFRIQVQVEVYDVYTVTQNSTDDDSNKRKRGRCTGC